MRHFILAQIRSLRKMPLNEALYNPQEYLVIKSFEESGFEIKHGMANPSLVDALVSILEAEIDTNSPHGLRNLFTAVPSLWELIEKEIVSPLLGENFKPVRSVYFDKIPGNNWNVAWHQDTTINVRGALPSSGYVNAKEKGGFISVEPPIQLIENMVTIRIHLDSADKRNGCLRVLPGSHKLGRVKSDKLLDMVEKLEPFDCEVEKGDVMLMRPLLFHSSRKSVVPNHRRVIHMECCSEKLPTGLVWHESTTSKVI